MKHLIKCVPSDFVCVDYEERKKYPKSSLQWMNEFQTYVDIFFTKTYWSLVPLISAVLSLKASELCHEVSLGEDLFQATALLPNWPHWLGQGLTRTAHARGRRAWGGGLR